MEVGWEQDLAHIDQAIKLVMPPTSEFTELDMDAREIVSLPAWDGSGKSIGSPLPVSLVWSQENGGITVQREMTWVACCVFVIDTYTYKHQMIVKYPRGLLEIGSCGGTSM